jgi:putative colanic acid biosynthesis acetyltransferase WcaF
MPQPDLSLYDNSWYSPGRNRLIAALWFVVGLPLLRLQLQPVSSLRRLLLRLFGANIGTGVVMKPGVRVKYPWHLSISANSWIGEDVWIDNLTSVSIGANVCVSQGAYICTGNHDWSDPAFGLKVKPITIEDGSWIGARALICPGVHVGRCAVAAAGSVVTRNIPDFEIHAGNPAVFVKSREFRIHPHAPEMRQESLSSELHRR